MENGFNNQDNNQNQQTIQFNDQKNFQHDNIIQRQRKKQTRLMILGVAILVIALVGVTYAFFNYTRTGTSNTIRVGKIEFESNQGQAMNLTNMFPIDVSEGLPNDNTKVGTVTVNVKGDTTYGDGIEYLVSAVNVSNGVLNSDKTLPISIEVTVEDNDNNDPTTTLGEESDDYFNERGSDESVYSVVAGDTIEADSDLLMGYIAPGSDGVDGNIVIKAYIDSAKVGISDTYPEATVRTVKTTGYSSSNCATVLTGVTGASTYCATVASLQEAIDEEDLTEVQIGLLVTAGIVEEYTDETPASFGEDREVFTTEEWNSLQANGVTFQIKVEAQEGTWLRAPLPSTITSCPGCVFLYTTNEYSLGNGTNATTTDEIINNGDTLYNSYSDLMTNTGKTVFFGLKVNETTHAIERAYICSLLKSTDPNLANNVGNAYCIEGTTDGSTYSDNYNLVTGPTLWNDTCETTYSYEDSDDTYCGDTYYAYLTTSSSGYAYIEDSESNNCIFYIQGQFSCSD